MWRFGRKSYGAHCFWYLRVHLDLGVWYVLRNEESEASGVSLKVYSEEKRKLCSSIERKMISAYF